MNKKKEQKSKEETINSFPSETLTACRSIVSQIVKREGDNTVSFKDIPKILDRSAGTLILPISTCQQYNLLQNVHGKGYKATALFHTIDKPIYETDRKKAILEALENAPLYKILIERFKGSVLPDEQGMSNLLDKEFKVKPYLLSKVVNVFFKNFREFDLIDSNNRLIFTISDFTSSPNEKPAGESSVTQGNESEIGDNQSNTKSSTTSPQATPQMFRQAIDIGGNGTATLEYPRNIDDSQVEVLRIHLEATLMALEARLKKKIKKDEGIISN